MPRTLLSAACLLAAILLAGCGTTTPTADSQPPPGRSGDANVRVGAIAIRDAAVAGRPPAAGDEAYSVGAEAPLVATIVNTGDAADRLASVSSPVASDVRLGGDTTLVGGSTLGVGYPQPDPALEATTRGTITLAGLREPLRVGPAYPVTFTFAKAGQVTVQVPVANPPAA